MSNFSVLSQHDDGLLADYEPPIQIKTELSTTGLTWKAGDDRVLEAFNEAIWSPA